MSRKRKPKNGPAWWPCGSGGKRGYASKLDALTVLSKASRKGACRAYLCPSCGRWHLTSQKEKRAAA